MLLMKSKNIREILSGIHAILWQHNKNPKINITRPVLRYDCGKLEICKPDTKGFPGDVMDCDFQLAFNSKNYIEVSTENQSYINVVNEILQSDECNNCIGYNWIVNDGYAPAKIFNVFAKATLPAFLLNAMRVFTTAKAFTGWNKQYKGMVFHSKGYTYLTNKAFLIAEKKDYLDGKRWLDILGKQSAFPPLHDVDRIIKAWEEKKPLNVYVVSKKEIETYTAMQVGDKYLDCNCLRAMLKFTKAKELEIREYSINCVQVVDKDNEEIIMGMTYLLYLKGDEQVKRLIPVVAKEEETVAAAKTATNSADDKSATATYNDTFTSEITNEFANNVTFTTKNIRKRIVYYSARWRKSRKFTIFKNCRSCPDFWTRSMVQYRRSKVYVEKQGFT